MRITVLLATLILAIGVVPTPAAMSYAGDGITSTAGSVGSGVSLAPCKDTAYEYLGGAGVKWTSPLRWTFQTSSVPASLSSSAVLAVIKRSFKNIVNERNDCGRIDRVSATASYLGTTSRGPNVTTANTCASPDGANVIGFGAASGYLAYTCVWWNSSGQIREIDMRINRDQPWALSLASCHSAALLEAVVTHEVGHAFGLGHVSELSHGRLTMSVYLDGLCENQEATLGLGDMRGLESLY